MGRKAVDLIAKNKTPYGRESIWEAIRCVNKKASEAGFTRAEIYDACKHEINKATIKTYMDSLVNGQYLQILNEVENTYPIRYKLENDCGAEAPRIRKDGSESTQGLGTECIWRTLKILAQFSIGELTFTANTSKINHKQSTVKSYVLHMIKAGYVRELPNTKPRRFLFVKSRDPGPKPPQIQRVKQVFDPNSQKVVWPIAEDAKGGAK